MIMLFWIVSESFSLSHYFSNFEYTFFVWETLVKLGGSNNVLQVKVKI